MHTDFLKSPALRRHGATALITLVLSSAFPMLQQHWESERADREHEAMEKRVTERLDKLETEIDQMRDKLQAEINRKQDRKP